MTNVAPSPVTRDAAIVTAEEVPDEQVEVGQHIVHQTVEPVRAPPAQEEVAPVPEEHPHIIHHHGLIPDFEVADGFVAGFIAPLQHIDLQPENGQPMQQETHIAVLETMFGHNFIRIAPDVSSRSRPY